MSTKPTCPDCGAHTVTAYYNAIVMLDHDGEVTVGGVTGGNPFTWECESCDEAARDDHLDEIGQQFYDLQERLGRDELESGWRSHEAAP